MADGLTVHLNVFISSPSDVADERHLARQVLINLEKEHAFRGKVAISEVSWDDPGAPVALAAHLTPQEAINRERPRPSECDLVLIILWSRLGTPLPAEYSKPDGSAYRSGTEWEFLNGLEAARRNNGRPLVWVYRRTEKVSLDADDPELPKKLAQRQAVKDFFAEFEGEGGALKGSYHPYGSPSEFAQLLERQLRELISKRLEALSVQPLAAESATASRVAELEAAAKPFWQGNPYRGLDPFGPGDTAIFFGRGLETDELLKRVRDGVRVLAVIGASGSGKSSLVAAGLLPRLAGGAVNDSACWVQLRFTPAEQGDNPFRALALALFPNLSGAGCSVDTLAERLAREPRAIEDLAVQVLTEQPAASQLLLFADQFEELFTARVAERYRQPFVGLIEAIAVSKRVRLVLTLRADYYEHCTQYSTLAALLREGSFPLAAPSGRALIEMIERPAVAAGAMLQDGLLEDILKDVGGAAGSLALLEFTLAQLYDLKRNGTLSREAYRQLRGVGGAIAIQGEKAVRGPSGKVEEAALWGVFDALSEVDENGGSIRRRAWLEDFPEAEGGLVESLIKARLLSGDRDDQGRPWVEVAHEAVLRAWPRFKEWLDQHREFKLWRKQLKTWMESREWLRGGPLEKAGAMLADWRDKLGVAERAYIEASVSAARRRKLLIRGGSALAFVLLGVFGGVNYIAAEAERERRRPIYREADWVIIEPGEFCMGSRSKDDPPGECPELPPDPDARPEEKPAHRVRIARAFKLAKYEVSSEEYDRFVYDHLDQGMRLPSDSGYGAGFTPEQRKRLPVINVSWNDAQAYAAWLADKLGKHFRLPSEAEWEYAARAQTVTPRFWPETPENPCRYANVLDSKNIQALKNAGFQITGDGFACADDYPFTAPVGRFLSNPWGLHDMLGNVWEWVEDCAEETYERTPRDGRASQSPDGKECGRRVFRGGSWINVAELLRSASRDWSGPDNRFDLLGFRLAQDL